MIRRLAMLAVVLAATLAFADNAEVKPLSMEHLLLNGGFEEGFKHYAATAPSQSEVEKAIISIVGRELRPLAPGEKSIVGFRRRLYGISDELRQIKRDSLISTSPTDILKVAQRLLELYRRASHAAMAAADAIDKAAESWPEIGKRRLTLPV